MRFSFGFICGGTARRRMSSAQGLPAQAPAGRPAPRPPRSGPRRPIFPGPLAAGQGAAASLSQPGREALFVSAAFGCAPGQAAKPSPSKNHSGAAGGRARPSASRRLVPPHGSLKNASRHRVHRPAVPLCVAHRVHGAALLPRLHHTPRPASAAISRLRSKNAAERVTSPRANSLITAPRPPPGGAAPCWRPVGLVNGGAQHPHRGRAAATAARWPRCPARRPGRSQGIRRLQPAARRCTPRPPPVRAGAAASDHAHRGRAVQRRRIPGAEQHRRRVRHAPQPRRICGLCHCNDLHALFFTTAGQLFKIFGFCLQPLSLRRGQQAGKGPRVPPPPAARRAWGKGPAPRRSPAPWAQHVGQPQPFQRLPRHRPAPRKCHSSTRPPRWRSGSTRSVMGMRTAFWQAAMARPKAPAPRCRSPGTRRPGRPGPPRPGAGCFPAPPPGWHPRPASSASASARLGAATSGMRPRRPCWPAAPWGQRGRRIRRQQHPVKIKGGGAADQRPHIAGSCTRSSAKKRPPRGGPQTGPPAARHSEHPPAALHPGQLFGHMVLHQVLFIGQRL